MKRLTVLAAFGLLTAAVVLPVQARGAAASSTATVIRTEQRLLTNANHHPNARWAAGLRAVQRKSKALPHSTTTRLLPAQISSQAPAPVDSNALALPVSVFSPATLVNSGAITAANAPLAPLHASTNSTIVGGYAQLATWKVDATNVINFTYQGSSFASSDAAHAYWAEITFAGQSDCSSGVGVPCTVIALTDPKTNTSFLFDIAQVNQCTVETEVDGPQAAMTTNSKAIIALTVKIFVAAITQEQSVCTASTGTGTSTTPTPTATPAATDFAVSHVFVEKPSAQDDSAPITHAKHKKSVLVAIDLHVNSAPSGASVSITLTAKRSGKVIFTKRLNGSLPAGDTSGDYRLTVPYKLPNKTGKLKFAAAATIGTLTQQASVNFVVK